jgi:putative salt-induced outer membrane protein YdiY
MPASSASCRLALLCCTLLVARAETWVLANGDRVTGTLLTQDAEVIRIQHAQLGLLTIPRSALPAAPAESKDPAGPAVSVPAVVSPAMQWKRQIDLGYAQQSGARDKQDLSVRLQIDGKSGANTFRGTARLLQTEADGLTVTDRREADFRWRHDVNRRLFTQTLTTYAEDSVRNIDLSLEQQFGGGYRLIDTPRHKANLGLGAVVQYLDRPDAASRTALLGSVFQDYACELNGRVKLTQESNFTYTEAGAWVTRSGVLGATQQANYRLKFNTGVQSKVNDHMSVNVRFEYDYDRSVVESSLRADQRLTTSLGYLW